MFRLVWRPLIFGVLRFYTFNGQENMTLILKSDI
jgi:hypothetical protein